MRLNAYISKSGYTSRRKADVLIKSGDVKINNEIIKNLSYQVEPGDKVSVKNRDIFLKNHVYIIFNKPEGVTATLEDKFADKKIIDFLPVKFKGVYPVGRLDKNSSGLIILTNDGKFCYSLTHPKFAVEKEYLIKVKGKITLADCQRAEKGVVDEGDLLKVKGIKIIQTASSHSLCAVVICEGKKRHLRRLFKQLGFKIQELKRIRIGKLYLGDLREGRYKMIERDKIYEVTGAIN